MGFFKIGAFSHSVSGKVGHTLFRDTESGIVASDYVIPTNPDTAAQQGIRSNFTRATQTWTSLTALQQEAWKTYALKFKVRTRGGKVRTKTGFNVYAGLTSKLLQVNPSATIPTDPPSKPFAGDKLTITATAGTGKITFTASAGNSTGTNVEFLVQPIANDLRKPQKGAYRSKGNFHFVSGTLSKDVALPTGTYAVGYRYVNTATGQETDPVYLPVSTVSLSVQAGNSNSKKKAA